MLEHHCAQLGAEARTRARRFIRPARRTQFVLGRALLRQALAELLELPAKGIVLGERASNSPELLSPPACAAGLSLAHSGPWIACAIGTNFRSGLDIEVIDDQRDTGALARQAFSAEHVLELAGMPENERLRRFYERWCEYEARFKLGTDRGVTCLLHHPDIAIAVCTDTALYAAPELRPVRLNY
jgi:4'-phosphopantetheinyl transferase